MRSCLGDFRRGLLIHVGNAVLPKIECIFLYILLCYCMPILALGHLFLLYIYKYIRVCVCSRYTHSIFGPDAATPHTEQTKK